MKSFLKYPIFWVGLLLRLLLLFAVTPQAESQWYLPFMAHSVHALTLDPWHSFLTAGGDPTAFPYGYTLWLILLPLSLFAAMLGIPMHWAYGATLLIVDLVILGLLRFLLESTDRALLALWWLSPVVLFATYWLGLNDLIPVAFVVVTLLCLKRQWARLAGANLGLAISAKLSMILAAPFLFFYLLHNKRFRCLFWPFMSSALVVTAFMIGPQCASEAGRQMLFSNPEMGKVFRVAFTLGDSNIYLLPLVYSITLFWAWRIRRMNFDMLLCLLGIGFLLVLLLTPAAAGWFVWVVPFLIAYQLQSDKIAKGLVFGFGCFYILFNVSTSLHLELFITSSLHTGLLTLGVLLAARIVREGVQSNEYFRLSRKPFILSIAGDSGTGKDTLAIALSSLFGKHSVTHLSGDNYHLWDRHKPMWQVVTHLNPSANDLTRFTHDLQAIVKGRSILTRYYDHEQGQLGKSVLLKSNDVIIASGLHVLYLPLMRELCDLSIYLDMDESLRRYLKIQRDVNERGHTLERAEESLKKRGSDAHRFIRPQRQEADLIFKLQPADAQIAKREGDVLATKLVVHTRDSLYYEPLKRILIGVCGLHINMNNNEGIIELTVEGEPRGEDMAMAAAYILPQMTDLLDTSPGWYNGMLGVMQLIVLIHMAQSLRARL